MWPYWKRSDTVEVGFEVPYMFKLHSVRDHFLWPKSQVVGHLATSPAPFYLHAIMSYHDDDRLNLRNIKWSQIFFLYKCYHGHGVSSVSETLWHHAKSYVIQHIYIPIFYCNMGGTGRKTPRSYRPVNLIYTEWTRDSVLNKVGNEDLIVLWPPHTPTLHTQK